MCLTDLANPQYKLVSAQGFEPRTHALEGRCSIQLSYAPTFLKMERVKGIEPSQPAWKAGTLPLSYTRIFNLYKVVEDGGFEPPKAMLTDLQSAPFGRSGNPPRWSW